MSSLILIVLLICGLGIFHSLLGEILIFRHLRKDGSWIHFDIPGLSRRRLRALWSTWHLTSLFGWFLAGVILMVTNLEPFELSHFQIKIGKYLSTFFFGVSGFWFLGTKGKHPAWLVFLLIAVIAWWTQ